MNLNERLQYLRKKAGYSQEQLAELLGISRQAISKWESGQGNPDIDNIVKLTKIYQVSADYILLGREDKTNTQTEPTPLPPKTNSAPKCAKRSQSLPLPQALQSSPCCLSQCCPLWNGLSLNFAAFSDLLTCFSKIFHCDSNTLSPPLRIA